MKIVLLLLSRNPKLAIILLAVPIRLVKETCGPSFLGKPGWPDIGYNCTDRVPRESYLSMAVHRTLAGCRRRENGRERKEEKEGRKRMKENITRATVGPVESVFH